MQILSSRKQEKLVSWKGRDAAVEENPIFAMLDFFFFPFLERVGRE